MTSARRAGGAALIAVMMAASGMAWAGDKPDYPPMEKVTEDLTKVVSTADGSEPLWELYEDRESGKLLAVLPKNYEKQLLMVACTISGGDPEAGVMGPTHYVKWEKIDKQLALVAPNLDVRTEGDKQAKDSIEELYTGRVLLSTPIVSMAPGGRPVIDLGAIATRQAQEFFPGSPYGGYGDSGGPVDARLARLTKAKAFPENLVVEYEAPRPGSGQIVRLTYSIGELEGTPGFKPRKADSRVGYFYDSYQDFSKPAAQEVTDRYIDRWYMQKADPSLKLSPPKQPIVWYIEHTTPVKYRRYVREGIEMWNEAFREIGIDGALEVYQQDATTGAHMDKDPEDARYNFFRWNASDQGYAIGPSRTNPFTGEILDADVVWHQGLTRSVHGMLENLSDDITDQAFSPETMAFLDEHPEWDPRIRLVSPEQREHRLATRALRIEKAATTELGDADNPWTPNARNLTNSACRMGNMLASDFSLAGAAMQAGMLEGADAEDLMDGLPEEFVGQMIRYISCHEVGHCLGLQHNMAASTIRSLEQINTPGFEGPTIGSVMDYVAVNINNGLGEVQGPYATTMVGPYDKWAIAFGYGPDDEVKDVLAQVSDPDHIFISQVAMSVGADPRNMTWDMGADNLEWSRSRLALVDELRGKLISDIVDDGEPWAVARRRYGSLLNTHLQSLLVASNWVGSSYINNDFKGDPGDRTPIEDVPAERQREALKLVIDHSFKDEAFGLTPEFVRHLGKEYWWDPQGINELMADPSLTVHDLVGGIQATALTFIMNPTTLRRVYDNEFRAEEDNPFTLHELMTTITDSAWSELDGAKKGMGASSFRRNLQREHLERLITLSLIRGSSPALRTISTLATQELRRIDGMAEAALDAGCEPYTAAHLADARARIAKTLDAAYVIGR